MKHLLGGIGRYTSHNEEVPLRTVTLGKMTDLGLTWTKGKDLLIPRGGHRSIAVENIIYTIGGGGVV